MFKKLLISMLLLFLVLGSSCAVKESNTINNGERKFSPTSSSKNESRAPRGDLANWKQVYVDDFDEYGNVPVGSFADCELTQSKCKGLTEPLRSRWWAFPKGWGDTARQHRYPVSGQSNPDETVSIEDGKLKIVMKSDGNEVQGVTLFPKAAEGQTYGKYVIRFKADPTPGYRIAWKLVPVDEAACPGCEISFPELELDQEITGLVRHRIGLEPSQVDRYQTDKKVGEWHIATIEWSPGSVEFFLDGEKLKGTDPNGRMLEKSSASSIPDQPANWFIQCESALDERAKKKQVVAQKHSTATIQIDWIAIYSYKGKNRGQEQSPDIQEKGAASNKVAFFF